MRTDFLAQLQDDMLVTLRRKAIAWLNSSGVNFADEAKYLIFELNAETEKIEQSANEISHWLHRGRGSRQGEDNPCFLRDMEHFDYCSWKLYGMPRDHEGAPPPQRNVSQIMVTIRCISGAVMASESAVREHSKKWGTPYRPNRKKGGGQAWLIEEIWQPLVEQYGDDKFAMRRLEQLRRGEKVTPLLPT